MVEIAKALSRDARLIVLDEPSAVLGDTELQGLFDVMRRLAANGIAFIYISHRLDEVFTITDRVTVMKDGRVVTTERTARPDAGAAGAADGRPGPRATSIGGARRRRRVRSRSAASTRAGVIDDDRLRVRVGEILGIAGLAGSGRTEVLRAIFGADPIDAGEITVFGVPSRIRKPARRDRARDRAAHRGPQGRRPAAVAVGGVQRHDHPAGDVSSRRVLSRTPRARALVERHIERLAIRTPGPRRSCATSAAGTSRRRSSPSGSTRECRILLIDEPTRGVDVGAKHEIYALLRDLAERGVAIVMVSSELPEILAVSDRVIVMREGRVTAELTRDEATEERIMHHATRHDS